MTATVEHGRASAIAAWHERHQDIGGSSSATDRPAVAGAILRSLVQESMLDLALPGAGQTRGRYEALAALGEMDLTVGRLAEAHVDAIAILAELDSALIERTPDSVWAVWASESGSQGVRAVNTGGRWRLHGRKAWCSGAGVSSYALVTAGAEDGPRLFAVDLRQRNVQPVDDPWPTPALSGTDTRSVDFHEAEATSIGGPGAYVDRPGFWHGAVGVAAVWYGGAVGVARTLVRAADRKPLTELNLAHLGAIGSALAGAHATLGSAADSFDAQPLDRSGTVVITARATRAVVESAVGEVVDRVGRALGAAPLALNREHSRRVADLQLYVRQSHADRDLADLGRHIAESGQFW